MKNAKKAIAIFLSVVLSMAFSFCSLADVFTESAQKYLIASGSDAVMAAPLPVAPVEPYSSLGTVTNTVNLTGAEFAVYYTDDRLGISNILRKGTVSVKNGRLNFSIHMNHDERIERFYFKLPASSLPSPGTYNFAVDLASDFSFEYSDIAIYTGKINTNAGYEEKYLYPDFRQESGDFIIPDYKFNLANISSLSVHCYVKTPDLLDLSGSVAFRFFRADPDPDAPSSAGSNTSREDYESSVSSGLSDISSGLSDAAESLNYISESQNLIIQGIDNIILHISDQLYAFWDQLYNLIHVPTMAMLQNILQAIKDLDINVNVDLDELKSTINNATNKEISNDNKNADDIKNGFNNSGMESDSSRLEDSLNEYDEAEKNVLDSVNDALTDFDFDADFSGYTATIKTVSDFLQALYESSGGFKIVINLSLLLSIASIVIGVYRFKDGG